MSTYPLRPESLLARRSASWQRLTEPRELHVARLRATEALEQMLRTARKGRRAPPAEHSA